MTHFVRGHIDCRRKLRLFEKIKYFEKPNKKTFRSYIITRLGKQKTCLAVGEVNDSLFNIFINGECDEKF